MSHSRKILAVVKNYSIALTEKDNNTFSVQIVDQNDQAIIADLPMDPLDRTLAAALDKDSLSKLGSDTAPVLEALSGALQEHIGAKEFVVVPAGVNLPNFVPAQSFARLRHASRASLVEKTDSILMQYPQLTEELDQKYKFVVGIQTITQALPHAKPYDEIFALLEGHANFSAGKMTEYKEEDVEGLKSRFNNSHVTPLAMLDGNGRLCGVIRVLAMGNQFGYLSDETMNQELIAAENFPGSSSEEQMKNRGVFLLAYLASRAAKLVNKQEHFLLIAAAGRESIYDAIGMQAFPLESAEFVATIKLAPPGPLLTALKTKLSQPFSNMTAVSRMGAMPAPIATPVTTTAEAQKEPTRSLTQ